MTEAKIAALKEIGKTLPVVDELLNEYLSFQEDPAKIFYLQFVAMTKALASDMKLIAEGDMITPLKLMAADKDDKRFDRVKAIMLDAETIFNGLKIGKQIIFPEIKIESEAVEDKKISSVDRIANMRKSQNK